MTENSGRIAAIVDWGAMLINFRRKAASPIGGDAPGTKGDTVTVSDTHFLRQSISRSERMMMKEKPMQRQRLQRRANLNILH